MKRTLSTPLGTLHLAATAHGLCRVAWTDAPCPADSSPAAARILDDTARQLADYLAGKRRVFDLPLDVKGTDFQRRAWALVAAIPFAETRSYKDLALALGDGNATRAVGGANARNPLCLVVPCHRVVASDGSLGGYAGGAGAKRALLGLERSVVTSASATATAASRPTRP